MFKDTLMYFLGVMILVTAVVMLVSFFVAFPKPLVIADTAALILSIAGYLFFDSHNKDDKDE